MKDTRKLPRLDFAASPWQYRVRNVPAPAKSKNPIIDVSPRLEFGLSVRCEVESETPDQETDLG
jgi:hypothetical protein